MSKDPRVALVSATGSTRMGKAVAQNVAARLGNTRTVSKKYYIHPGLITSYEAKKLDKILKPLKTKELTKEMHVESEKAFLKFLKQLK